MNLYSICSQIDSFSSQPDGKIRALPISSDSFDKSVVTEFREKKLNSIVEITRFGNSDYREEGLTAINRPHL